VAYFLGGGLSNVSGDECPETCDAPISLEIFSRMRSEGLDMWLPLTIRSLLQHQHARSISSMSVAHILTVFITI
jgi:hypothetical protein